MDFPTQLFLDGAWRDAASGATFDATDPATGGAIAAVADAGTADVEVMIDAAETMALAHAGRGGPGVRRRRAQRRKHLRGSGPFGEVNGEEVGADLHLRHYLDVKYLSVGGL